MCAAVRRVSSLHPVLMARHAKQLENFLYILLKCWSVSQCGEIFAECKPFVTEMITKHKAPFHFVYSVSRWVGWLNSEKEVACASWWAFEIMHAAYCSKKRFPASYTHSICHTFMPCDIIKPKKCIWYISAHNKWFIQQLVQSESVFSVNLVR